MKKRYPACLALYLLLNILCKDERDRQDGVTVKAMSVSKNLVLRRKKDILVLREKIWNRNQRLRGNCAWRTCERL